MSKGKDLEVKTSFILYKNKCQLSFANFEYTCLEKCGFEMYEFFVFYTRGGKSCGCRSEGSLFPGGRAVMDSWTLHTLTLKSNFNVIFVVILCHSKLSTLCKLSIRNTYVINFRLLNRDNFFLNSEFPLRNFVIFIVVFSVT